MPRLLSQTLSSLPDFFCSFVLCCYSMHIATICFCNSCNLFLYIYKEKLWLLQNFYPSRLRISHDKGFLWIQLVKEIRTHMAVGHNCLYSFVLLQLLLDHRNSQPSMLLIFLLTFTCLNQLSRVFTS